MNARTCSFFLMLLAPCLVLAEQPAWTVGTAEQLQRAAAMPTGANDHAVAVRFAEPPKIDGDLGEWKDVPAQVSYLMPALKDTHSAAFRFAYDNEALYVAAHVVDYTPLVNARPPLGGDAIRIGVDAGQCTIASFAKSDQAEAVSISGSSSGSVSVSATAAGSGGGGINLKTSAVVGAGKNVQVWRRDPDGRGYSFEAQIAWSNLAAKPDMPNVRIAWEVRWGDKAGTLPVLICQDGLVRHVAGGQDALADSSLWGKLNQVTEEQAKKLLAPASSGLPEIACTLKTNSYVSIVIDDANDRRVRNLIAEAPRLAGTRREVWDGRDDAGKLLPPGSYRWRGIRHTGLEPQYLMSYNNPGTPPYITDNASSWGADHDVPRQVATGGGRMYLGWNNCEAGSSLIATDLTGRKLWGWRASLAAGWNLEGMAANDKYVFLAKSGWGWARNDQHGAHLIRFDGATGRAVDWPKENGGVGEGVLTVREWAPEEKAAGPRLNGVSVGRDGTLYLSLLRENIVEMRNAETGAVTGKLDVPSPGGSAIDAAGRLLVVSGKKLLRIDLKTGKQETLREFEKPENVAVGPGPDGHIYVSDWGAMQVRHLDANGRTEEEGSMGEDGIYWSGRRLFVHDIGFMGRRPTVGAWKKHALLKPEGIAIDPQGRLWVAEADSLPKRFSVWDNRGNCREEFVGPSFYGGTTSYLDPDDPAIAYAASTKFKLDYAKKTCQPVAVLGRNDRPGAVFWQNEEGHFYKLNGKRYFVSKGGGYTFLTVFAVEPDRLRALASIGNARELRPRYVGPELPGLTAAKDTDWFSWSDKNGDALVQNDELQFSTPPKGGTIGTYWGGFPGKDLTIYMPIATYSFIIWKYTVTGWTACGAPIYDLTKAGEFGRFAGEGFESTVGFIGADGTGRVLIRGVPVMAFRPDGSVDWTYPSRYALHGSGSPPPAPGLINQVHLITGVAPLPKDAEGEIFAMNGNEGEWYLMTTDGVFVQRIFRDNRVGGHRGPEYVMQQESFGGDFELAADGKYYIVAGHTDNRVFRLDGVDSIRRFAPAELAFTTEHYAAAQHLIADERFATKAAKTARVPRLAVEPGADTFVQDWPDGSLTEWTALNGSRIAVRKAWTGQALHLRYEVADASPLKNNGEDAKLLFKYGDSVDVQLAGNPQADPARKDAVAGDVRLLMTEARGKLVATLYEPVVPGVGKGVGFASPWRSVSIGRVTQPAGVRMRATRTDRGYTFEAVVPWAALGAKPQAGLQLRGDFGVLFGNDAGEITVLRSYWSNENTSIVSDVPSEVTIEPRQWGVVVLE